MRNLKRALSLVLAAMMLIGMMVVGANAAAKDFTDKDEIQNSEAVNTLVTLNVISGKEDGSYFDPTGTLTRAEMAKIISYVMNGGVEPVLGVKDKPTYSDIDGHWAEAYIEYCTSMGIINGDGAGKFNPEGTLTGSQAAKMFLTAMGYNAEVFGFVGNSWETNTNRYANEAGLYKDLGGLQPSAPISRDDAAQMAYNAILARMMTRDWTQNQQTGQITEGYRLGDETLFSSKFNGTAYEGILVSSGKAAILGTSASKDYFKVQLKKVNGVDLTATSDVVLNTVQSFKYVGQDLTDMMGEYVKVLYNNKTKEIYGVYSVTDMNTVITTTSDKVKDATADSITIDGVDYTTDSNLGVTNTYADTVKFVDNDGDNELDLVIPKYMGLYTVNYVGTTTFTLSALVAGRDTKTAATQKLADVIAYDGMAKDDVVLVYTDSYTGKDVIAKADVQSGTISGKRDNTNANTYGDGWDYMIDGTWYSYAAGWTTPDELDNGTTVDYVALGSKLYYVDITSGASSLDDVAMLITYSSDNVAGVQAKLLFANGDKKTVTLSTDGVIPGTGDCGKLYTYEVTNAGEYELTLASTTGDLGNYKYLNGDSDNVTSANNNSYVVSNGKIASVAKGTGAVGTGTGVAADIADDAVIFLFKGANSTGTATQAGITAANAMNDGKVITGKDLKTLAASDSLTAANGTTTASGVLQNYGVEAYSMSTNGLTKIAAATATCNYFTNTSTTYRATWPVATSAANYGYLVAAPYTTAVDGTKYVVYPVWDGTQTVNYMAEGTQVVAGAAKYAVIGYDVVDAETIKNVTVVGLTNAAVSGLGGDEVQFSGNTTTYTFDGNTKYLYVNSGADTAAEIGVEGGSVQLATEVATGVYVQNVKYMDNDGDDVIDLIVVDTENKLADATVVSSALTATVTDTTVTFSKDQPAIGDIITVTVTADSGKCLSYSSLSVGTLGSITGSVTTTVDSDNNITALSFNVLVTSISSNSVTITGVSAATITPAP